MTLKADKELTNLKRQVAYYNMIANLFWSAISLTPISVFCYRHMSLTLLFIFLGISMLSATFPKSFYDSIQLSHSPVLYKKIGVKFINRFTQNGTIINRLLQKKYPDYKVVAISNRSLKTMLGQTYMFEKFHFWVFLFFLFTTVYAFIESYYYWVLILITTNLVFNIYPSFLQQYIRVKLSAALNRIR